MRVAGAAAAAARFGVPIALPDQAALRDAGDASRLDAKRFGGDVVLTGDLAHFKDNWDNDRVPTMNTSADQTHASHAKIMKVLADKKAQLWINHDKATSDSQKHSPAFYD